MVNEMYKLPLMYLEYSGQYGDVEKVEAASRLLTNTQLFYGGGITSIEQAREMACDTIVVILFMTILKGY